MKRYTKIDRKLVHAKFEGRCAYCGCVLENETGKHMHVDHIEPVYRDVYNKRIPYRENNNPENLNPACVRCNLYKSTLSVEHFREWVKNSYHVLEKVTAYNNAIRFGMLEVKEWDGLFYFEKYEQKHLAEFELRLI